MFVFLFGHNVKFVYPVVSLPCYVNKPRSVWKSFPVLVDQVQHGLQLTFVERTVRALVDSPPSGPGALMFFLFFFSRLNIYKTNIVTYRFPKSCSMMLSILYVISYLLLLYINIWKHSHSRNILPVFTSRMYCIFVHKSQEQLGLQHHIQAQWHCIIWPAATQADDHLTLSIAASGQPWCLDFLKKNLVMCAAASGWRAKL